MTISVRSRISVTTPDGRSHTGVVTGLRGQGMADLLLDDGRAIRQPVSALRPVLARTNGRHARLNPRARRNTGDNYARLAELLLNGGDFSRLTDADRVQLTGSDTPAPAIIKGILARLQGRRDALLSRVDLSDKTSKGVDNLAATLHDNFVALAANGDNLDARFDSAISSHEPSADSSREQEVRDYVLLSSFLSLLQDEQLGARREAQERVKDKRSQREEQVKRSSEQAERVRTGRQEQRTTEERLRRERRERLGGIDLSAFIEREKVAVKIIPDPLRATRDKSYLCGNALDGYAYTLASTAERRSVRHWLTWRDLGFTEQGVGAAAYEVQLAARRGERPESKPLDFAELSRLFTQDEDKGTLSRPYSELPVRRVGERKGGAGESRSQIKRTPVSHQDGTGRVDNEFEVNIVDEVPENYAKLPSELQEALSYYVIVDVKPALQRVRAGSQTGSLYPRRPMPPESPTPGELNPDAPVLFALRSGSSYDVFGFTVDRAIETATAILDKYKPYPGYSYKDRNPYFSWQPEAAGQFSAMQGKKGERPCNNPEVVAKLNALRKASYTMQALVKSSRRLNEVLSASDGIHTLNDAAVKRFLLPAYERVIGACVRVVRLNDAIEQQKYIAGLRRDSTSDFALFSEPESFAEAVSASAHGDDARRKVQELTAAIRDTKTISAQLAKRTVALQIVETIAEKTIGDVEIVRVEASDVQKHLAKIAGALVREVVIEKSVAPDEQVPGITQYAVSPQYANAEDAPFLLVAGALCREANLADVVTSLFPLELLASSQRQQTSVAQAMPDVIAKMYLGLARKASYDLDGEQRKAVIAWWSDLRSALRDQVRSSLFSERTSKARVDKFQHLLDLLIARQIASLEGGDAWKGQSWNNKTDPSAAVLLYLYSSTFLGDAKVGGLLGKVQARLNAGRGSTETDDMSKRTAARGYTTAEPLTQAQLQRVKDARLTQRVMPRAETREMSARLMQRSMEAVEAAKAKQQQEAPKASAQNAGIASFADDLKTSLEFAQNALVGGGTVREVSGNVKMHYTYNPLLFQLVRLYYNADGEQRGQEPVPVLAAPTATPNPAPKRVRDIYTEMAEALALAADERSTEISLFAMYIPELPPPPMQTTAQLVTRIVERMRKHPKNYQKSLSRLAGKQIPLVQVINELQKTLPRAQDILRFYRSRIEGAAAKGTVTNNADADQKVLLLFAVYEALSAPPGTPAREEYTEAHFSAEATIPKPRVTVTPPRQRPPAPRPESPLLQAERGDVFTMPKQAQNLFTGFSREKPGGGKGEYEIINKPLLYMIDWIGVYGSLLDLVRRAMLAVESRDDEAPSDWSEVHDGWLLLFRDMDLNGTMKDIPQLWLDLCPAAEKAEVWAKRYRAIAADDTGEEIKNTVLAVKERAARGLSYAGELARRGFGETKYQHEMVAVDTAAPQDVIVRDDGQEVDDARIRSLRQLLVANAAGFTLVLRAANEDERAQRWANIGATKGDAEKLSAVFPNGPAMASLISVSIKPLRLSGALSADEAVSITGAIIEPSTGKARSTITLTHSVFTAYVRALMTFYFRTKEDVPKPEYPTAPRSKMIYSIQATAGDAPVEQEPADSFLGISLDRENMRKTLLFYIEKEREALKVKMLEGYGARKRAASKS